jgi:adenylosuccinate synthase
LNFFEAIALTKLDILDQMDEIKIGVDYLKDGKIIPHYPSSEQDYEGVTVDYITMPGWKTDISNCRNFQNLPENAQNYVTKIEQLLGVHVGWVGVGQSRDAIIKRTAAGPPTTTTTGGVCNI